MSKRKRHLASSISRLSTQYPVVVITGPRQSGKTTLSKELFPEKPYVNLENLDVRDEAQQDPNGFLRKFPDGAIIDEIQRVPHLFSYIQTIVDSRDKEGLFILTGSQNFRLMESISQSLAGRVALVTLLPFSLSELTGEEVDDSLETILYRGFYPRIYDKKLNPTEAMAFYVATYLERDIRELVNVKDFSKFHTFLKLCAARSGHILNMQDIASGVGVSVNTVKEWISVLETSYVIALVQPHFNNLNKRLIKSPKLHFLDSGLLCYLLGIHHPDQLQNHPLKGHIFESFVVAECVKSYTNAVREPSVYFFRENNNHEIDLILDDVKIAVEIKSSETFSDSMLKHLKWYLEKSEAIEQGWLIYAGQQARSLDNITLIPFRQLLENL